MEYVEFTIEHYKAIDDRMLVDVSRHPLLPIVGLNESGKTMILEAILAFDKHSDGQNESHQLKDIANLSRPGPTAPARITAKIELTNTELSELYQQTATKCRLANESPAPDGRSRYRASAIVGILEMAKSLPGDGSSSVQVCRVLDPSPDGSVAIMYECPILKKEIDDGAVANVFAEAVVDRLPYILYFDDFRERREYKIPLDSEDDEWTRIIEVLFERAKCNLKPSELRSYEPKRRKSAISRAEKHLRERLASQWSDFHLDTRDPLEIEMEYIKEEDSSYIHFHVIEPSPNGDNYFEIADRSKGFYWFFSFVMKLEFNSKFRESSERQAIFLLDEPGSFLHAAAQRKLSKKLADLSESNHVVYSSHSHHMLDPEVVPYSAFHVATRDEKGSVSMHRFVEQPAVKGVKLGLPYQAVLDALKYPPGILDILGERLLFTEGVTDFQLFSMFGCFPEHTTVVPGTGAESLHVLVSLAIASGRPFVVVLDDDSAGRKARTKLVEFFGDGESYRFVLLDGGGEEEDSSKPGRKVILQDLIDGEELRAWRTELDVASNASARKVITAAHYSRRRAELISMSPKTAKRVEAALSQAVSVLANSGTDTTR